MKFIVRTKVDQQLSKVKEGFNESLFLQLSPPFPKVELKRFDGSKPGDIVSLELNFILFKQPWISEITSEEYNESSEYYFIDEGVKLPFGLKFWKHKHILSREGHKTMISDEVEFKSWNALTSLLLFPIILSQFFYRKPIYKRIFGQN